MLKFVSAYLALSYLAFSALAVAGLLQVLAGWGPLVGFALLDYGRKPTWRRALGPSLIVAAYGWFFGTRREILAPGPAGVELTILFGAGVLLALGLTALGASILRPYRRQQEVASLPAGVETHEVELCTGLRGLLFNGSQQKEPGPGVCLVPDPSSPRTEWQSLVESLLRRGFVVLVPSWEAAFQRYPDALALVPTAMSFLSRYPLVDGGRLAVAGSGLGGDLALRAAAADRQVKAVLALAPLLQERSALAGFGLLCEMTYPEALAWRLDGRRRQLVHHLNAIEATREGTQKPGLVLHGSQDGIVRVPEVQAQLSEANPALDLRTVSGEGHVSLARSSQVRALGAQWLANHLKASSA